MKLRKKIKRFLGQARLYYRKKRFSKGEKSASGSFEGLVNCDIYYINLRHRTDRKQKIEREFKRIGISTAIRFEALKNSNGALGCAQSHLALLKSYVVNKDKLLMICEDDCEFIEDRSYIDQIIKEFFLNDNLDVLCLAFNHRNGVQLNQRLEFTSDTQTLACYILKPHMVPQMINVAFRSADELKRGLPQKLAAIDVVWKDLQKEYVFVVPTNRIARQSASYSDIEKKPVKYGV